MLNSSVLDVAIGVVFAFLLLSVLATAVNEVIFSFLNMRGKLLLKGISTLLGDIPPFDTGENGFVSKIYNHGQVYGLYRGPFAPSNEGELPSYIPARNFAIALLDTISQPFSEMPPATPTAAQAINAGPQAISQQAMRITQGFKDAVKKLADNPATCKVGVPLQSMTTMAGNDALKLQMNVEDWFNSGMDRVSGHYKFNTQRALLCIGLVIAIAMNADTIHIIRQLSNDSTLRQALVTAAGSAKAPTPPTGQPAPDAAAFRQQITDTTSAYQGVTSLGLPVGWPTGSRPKDGSEFTVSQRIGNTLGWIYSNPSMIVGWLFTALAISLGAPFWFDMLNKIMVVRSTIKPTEKSQAEGSKDKPAS